MERDEMMVFARHDTSYWSQKLPSIGRDGNCKDGDKLLCNICPLKHEARERERGVNALREHVQLKPCRRKTCAEKYN